MKIKALLVTLLSFSLFNSYAQVSENFDKSTLSSGSLACWESSYEGGASSTARVAAPTPQPLSSDTRLSLNTASPITGSASLRVAESFTIPVYNGYSSSEVFYSPATGVDGNTVSFDVRVNSAAFLPNQSSLYVVLHCGSYSDYTLINSSNVGSVLNFNKTISGSNGGGVIEIEILYSFYTSVSSTQSYSYSIDVDNFTTNAAINPNNACGGSLPVVLTTFSASKADNGIKLDWATSLEKNSARFEIQRSRDAQQWEAIGSKASAGESTRPNVYQFVDTFPLFGANYYRLKLIDKDGTFEYSRVRSVEFENPANQLFVHPNPAKDKIFITKGDGGEVSASDIHEVSLINSQGAILNTSGFTKDGMDLKNVSSGIYLLKIKLTNGKDKTHRILINK